MRNNLFSPSQPINHSVSERVSLSASTRLEKLFRNKRKGSVTVEAAATVPLFFLAVVTLLYLLEMMAVHTAVRSSLQYAGKQAAKDTCITQMLMPSKVERDVVYAIGETRMERSIIAGGSSGMDCSASRMSVRTGIGTLNAEYQVKIPVPVFGIRPVKCRETMKIKAWSGYEKEGLSDMGNDTVYVTENGLVYHKDYHCSYLDLSIRMTHMGTVSDLRNESGGRYYPCEHCMKCRNYIHYKFWRPVSQFIVMQWIKTDNLCDTGIGGSGKGGMFQMWTVSRIVAMVILTGLSFMDYKIRKVPRDVLLLCMAGTVLYQAVTQNIDWMVSLGGGLIGMIFIGISKITREAIGYGDSLAILILGIYLGVWGLLEVLATSFFILGILALGCVTLRRKKSLAFPFYPFLTVGYLFGVCIGGL